MVTTLLLFLFLFLFAGDVRGEDADFSSRWFGPGVGVPEDPVTGSAHCALAPLFLGGADGAIVGYQASARGGVVRCAVAGDRVRLTGKGVTVMKGGVGLR